MKSQLPDTRTYANVANLYAKPHHTPNKVYYTRIIIWCDGTTFLSVEEVASTSCYREPPRTIYRSRPAVRALTGTKSLLSHSLF